MGPLKYEPTRDRGTSLTRSRASALRVIDSLLFLPGMVLVRTETGQLVMVPQQVLAQAQAKLQQGQAVANITQRPATPTATTTIRVSTATTVGPLQDREHLQPLGFPQSWNAAKSLPLIGQMLLIGF